jgi:hypothetical protein
VLHDPDLDPLRQHPDFQALVNRYVPSLKAKTQPKKQTQKQTKTQKTNTKKK